MGIMETEILICAYKIVIFQLFIMQITKQAIVKHYALLELSE